MRVALLSNINMNGTIRHLKRNMDVYSVEGYGNEIGTLMNPMSSIYDYDPDIIFIVNDLLELLEHNICIEDAEKIMDEWFHNLSSAIHQDIIYYISDAVLFGKELDVLTDTSIKADIEYTWQNKLDHFVKNHPNARIFPYKQLIEKVGFDNSFSMKMWYMGKVIHSQAMQQLISDKIVYLASIETRSPKKVLALDLDNTLWGGLAGEDDIKPVVLSDDHTGLAYKNLQRVIKAMKDQGVILVIVSKNNEDDAKNIIENHPHMILRLDDFADTRINWENKAKNLKEIAEDLNIGLDSIVFFDDSATERQIIKDMLPDVVVSSFPDAPEDLADKMIELWRQYFSKPVVTAEDKNKTVQYQENKKRDIFKKEALSFEEYLKGLEIVLARISEKENLERATQLLNKTNQFNLTTKRHTINEIQGIVSDRTHKMFVYRASDRFGDYGIIAVTISRIVSDVFYIDEFVMSCRVMGKNIENAILEDMEEWAKKQGCRFVIGKYVETTKNLPVKFFYPNMGYEKIESSGEFKVSLTDKLERDYRLKKIVEEDM